jgi:hypothetical protein
MRLKAWEVAVAVAAAAFAAVFLFSSISGLGFGLLAADLLWVTTRIEILENHDEPGNYTTLRGQLGILKLVLLLGINGAAIYGIVLIEHDFGARARGTVVADFAIIGLCFMLLTELWRSGDAAMNWFVGARAEREVGAKLAVFESRGWLLLHGYKRERSDIDHVLCGPGGAFAIETKSYGYRPRDVGQAASNAAWLSGKLQNRWVTGVLCVDEDRPPWRNDKIWVVSHRDIVRWLEDSGDKPIDPGYARSRLVPAGNARRGWRSDLRSRLWARALERAAATSRRASARRS